MSIRSIKISVLGSGHTNEDNNNDLNAKVLTKRQLIIYTIIIIYINLTFGITVPSFPSAYVDFSHLLNTSMAWIGLIASFESIGTLAGSCVNLLYKWVNRQIALVILTMGMGLTTIFIPYSTELWQLYLCVFIYGLGDGAWSGAINVWLIEMWQNKSSPILQLAQFINGIGNIVGPLIVKNYIIGNMICPGVWPQDCDGYNQTFITSTLESTLICTEECLHYDRRPRLKIPFLIAGILMSIGPTSLLVMFFIKRYYYKNHCPTEVAVNEELEARHKQYVPKNTILIGITIFFAFAVMSMCLYFSFSSTFFQYQPTLRLSASIASEISSTISAANCVGVFICIFITIYVKPQYLISIRLFLVFFGLLFQIFGQDQLDLLWTSGVIIGLGYSSLVNSMFSYVSQYMDVTDGIGGLFIGAYCIILIITPIFLGQLITIHPSYFLYIEITCLSVGIIAFSIVCISVKNIPKDLIRKLVSNSEHKGSVGD